ncbi:MAG: hypothetical protein IJ506_03220, partial [Clostridia bacterium]|nr:hypothetical protein [Clostridia bacterium]
MKKRTTLLAAFSAFALTLTGAIFALPETTTANATTTTPYTIAPIEDLIDSTSEIYSPIRGAVSDTWNAKDTWSS